MSALNVNRRVMAVLWPAFLMTCVLEALVFALVDPANLRWWGGAQVELSNSAIYSLAFFVFWAVIAGAGALTQWLSMSTDDVNQRPQAGPAPR